VDLSGAGLGSTKFVGADLSGANLTGAILTGAILYETLFIRARLVDTVGLEACTHHGPSTLALR
jgi:uncharacterized protein YjbI with pentapeptide repeats